MTDAEKTNNLITDLSWMLDRESYRHFLTEYRRLCSCNSAEVINRVSSD